MVVRNLVRGVVDFGSGGARHVARNVANRFRQTVELGRAVVAQVIARGDVLQDQPDRCLAGIVDIVGAAGAGDKGAAERRAAADLDDVTAGVRTGLCRQLHRVLSLRIGEGAAGGWFLATVGVQQHQAHLDAGTDRTDIA